MATTAWRTLGAATWTNNNDGLDWGLFGNPSWDLATLQSADGTRAYGFVSSTNGADTEFAQAYSFGFTTTDVPANATIDGVEFRISGCGSANGGRYARFKSAFIIKDGVTATREGTNEVTQTAFQGSDNLQITHGGATNLWGTTISAADVVSSNFGISIQVERDTSAGNTGSTAAEIDGPVEMRVHFTTAGGGSVDLSGSMTTAATLAGTLTVGAAPANLSGSMTTSATLAGTITAPADLSGSMTTSATLVGTITAPADLSGSMTTSATLAGTIQAPVDLSGSMTTAATLAGTVVIGEAPADLSGSMTTAATLAGTIEAPADLSGSMTTAATLAGTIQTPADLSGSMTTSATLAGTLTVGTLSPADLSGSMTTAATLAGTIRIGAEPALANSTDYPAANEAFALQFFNVWSPSGFPFAFENEKFDPPSTPWARMTVRHNQGTQNTLGRRRNRKFDRLGSLIVQIFTPLQEGTRRSKDLVQRVVDGFEGESITGTTICFNDVTVREIGVQDDAWYMSIVEINFRYTEVK